MIQASDQTSSVVETRAPEPEGEELARIEPQLPLRSIVNIEPTHGWRSLKLGELWEYRELLYILVWRDLKVRYRQTVLGAMWVMGQPLLTMLIFTLLFNRLARINSGDVPYSVLVLTGLLPWNFFAAAVQNSGNSLIGSSHLISKVYFPRLLVPTGSVVAAIADFFVSLLVLIVVMAWHGLVPDINIIFLFFVYLILILLTLGLGLWLSALNVEFRDVRIIVPFILQIWMFATPIVYPISLIPEKFRNLVALNPMTGVVEGFRWGLLGNEFPLLALTVSTTFAVTTLVSGAFFFCRMERRFVDVL